ncbi:mediator of DNA damage checkpoint protein 1-like [Rana temporaria]|uniref:mediator of DNA damage checkpoint protein 1-like n=1 Tax=Rana temporaria TaxID=8407 RepID=UPI001AACC22B|nr:mediator of DNA damage checkpoint protein 1-like [Rana temporaria]
MLLTVTPLENPGPPSPVPPPIAPKPGKNNVRLQRLLRKTAKKNGAQPLPTQSPKTFRSTLSPVTERDIESPEPAAAQKKLPPPLTLPPRFQIRGVTHRVPSPYPKHNFTFTVPEQQSLNQYLSPSPTPDTPSPRPSGSSTHDNPFLFPSGGCNSDHGSLRVNANASPRPCTPRHVTFNPTQNTQPVAPLISISDLPVIIVAETEPGLDIPNEAENIRENQDNIIVPNTESGHSTLNSPLPDQQRLTSTSISCNTVCLEDNTVTLQAASATSVAIHKTEICLTVAETRSNSSTLPSRPTEVNQTITAVHIPDGGLPSVAEVKTTSPPPEVKSVPKPVKSKPAILETDASTSSKLPNSEEGNMLKSPERPKPPRKKPGGWARLMKHLVVEPDEPKFPEPQKTEGKKEKKEEAKVADTETTQQSKGLRANKMWDALLYHMATSSKGQEKPASAEESTPPDAASAPAPPQFPFLRFRLPLLLHRPRFDARKLKEAAARPLRKFTAFFHRRITDKSTSTFNRTASGWSLKGEDVEQEKIEGDATEVKK